MFFAGRDRRIRDRRNRERRDRDPGVPRALLADALRAGELDVVGLAEPLLAPVTLRGAVFLGPVPASVDLVYGLPDEGEGPQLVVTTAWHGRPGARPDPVELAERLARLLPPGRPGDGPLRLDDRPVLLDGRPCEVRCQLGDGARRWAARLAVPGPAAGRTGGLASRVEVTLVAREFAQDVVALAWIGDVEPLLAPP